MKTTPILLPLFSLLASVLSAQQPWQQITVPSVAEAAANFKAPPREYGAIQPFLGWNGLDAADRKARIEQDLDRLAANGIFVVNHSPGRGTATYGGVGGRAGPVVKPVSGLIGPVRIVAR